MSRSVERVVRIIDSLSEQPADTATLAANSGIDRSTMARTLQVLERAGYVRRRSDRSFVLGYRLLSFAHGAFDQVALRRAAYVPLRQLQQITGVTVHLAELLGNDVTFIDKAESLEGVGLFARIGQPLPCYATSVGKVILAMADPTRRSEILAASPWLQYTENTVADRSALDRQLAEIREKGWAADDREFDSLVNCVGVPILSEGEPIGALSITSIQTIADLPSLMRYVPMMERMSKTISAALAGR
jgi:DNA-binding IclR family transcriptional regulator